MEIMQIKYFLEVAKTEHITQSAEKLHIAQPALSQSIHRLENELGVKLFRAKGRNVELTEYGKYLKDQLEPMIDKLDELPKTLQKMAKINNQTIHLSVLAASTVVTDAIIEYQSNHKNINFEFVQSPKSDMYDIEITTQITHNNSNFSNQNQFVCQEKIFLAVPKYKYNKSSVNLSEVADENFISLSGSKQFRYICDRYCRRAEINPHIIFESDSPYAVKNMIGANLGIGFWPEFTWGVIDNDNVKLLEILIPECSRDIVVTCNKASMQNENVEDFYSFLQSFFTKIKIKNIK